MPRLSYVSFFFAKFLTSSRNRSSFSKLRNCARAAVMTHFGMQMIFKGPAKEARLIETETGVPTIAATDRMQIKLGETINVQKNMRRRQSLNDFL